MITKINPAKLPSIEGFVGIKPIISKVTFDHEGYISIHLKDGRIFLVPLKYFPSIAKMNSEEKKDYFVTSEQVIIWDACDEVFHIDQFLGREEDYRYKSVAEPKAEYGSK